MDATERDLMGLGSAPRPGEVCRRSTTVRSFAVTAVALFIVALDNLVVITTLPVIKRDL